MPAPGSGIFGGRREIARPANCGGPGGNYRVSRIQLYVGICSGFILLYAPAFLSLLWQALASTPGAACDLLGEAAAPQAGSRQHKATHKLA